MRTFSLSNAVLIGILAFGGAGCGRKGDPIPRAWAEPRAPEARFVSLRLLDVTLPTHDQRGEALAGLEQIRVIWVPVGTARPSAAEVLARGEVVLEQRRPDLPAPGRTFRLDLRDLDRPAGWLVVVAVRVGNVVGQPTAALAWLDPAL